jgi:biotin transport system substrate-specific component
VPLTGQTFGVLVVGGALGFRRGFAAVALYVLLGVIGLPFFAEGKGGFAIIWGATGGYLIGFMLAGALVGRLAELGWDRHLGGALGAMFLGEVVIYAIGLPWLKGVTGLSWEETIAVGLTPFIVWDLAKVAVAGGLFPSAWWLVGRRPEDR